MLWEEGAAQVEIGPDLSWGQGHVRSGVVGVCRVRFTLV